MSSSAPRSEGLDYTPCFQGRTMASDDRSKLLNILAKYAYDFVPGGFMLASGQPSDEYLDCKRALSHADAMPLLGAVFLARLHAHAVAVGGLTMGADSIAMATSYASAGTRGVQWLVVRKEAKLHGRRKLIEGDAPDGAKVVVVDDVVTTGGSTIQAIRDVRSAGLQVVQVLVLVDREQNDGLNRIRAETGPGVDVIAMFKKSEIKREWESQKQTLRAIA